MINPSQFKNPYTRLFLNDGKEVVVKLEYEGVVVDVWQDGEVIESTWNTYQEMEDGE